MRFARVAAAALVLALGLLYLLRGLPWDEQARLSYDSFRYLAGADSILKTGRYLDLDGRPQQVWPPGLSLLYAAVARVTATDPLDAVRTVNLVSYAALALACFGIAAIVGLRIWIATAMLAAVILNGALMAMHNKLWSEPPALAALAVTLLCLIAALRNRGRATELFLAGCAAASVGIALRYALLALVPVLMLAAVMMGRKALSLIALVTPLPSLIAVLLLGAQRGNRAFAIGESPWRENFAALAPLADQVFPLKLLGVFAVLLFIVWCVVLPAAVAARAQHDHPRSAALVAALWYSAYAAFLVIVQMLTAPSFTIDLRILMPFYLGAIIAVAATSELVARRNRAAALLLAIPLILAALRGARFAATQSFARENAAPSCVARAAYVDAIHAAAPPGPLVSNAQGVVWLATRRSVAPMAPGAPNRGTVIWIDPQSACPGTVEQPDVAPPQHAHAVNGLVIARP